MRKPARLFAPTSVTLATAYADQSQGGADNDQTEELIIPENLEELEYSAVADLYERAAKAFDELYEEETDGDFGITPEQLETLASLTDSIEALMSELSKREAEVEERTEKAKALADRVHSLSANTNTEEQTDEETTDEEQTDEDTKEESELESESEDDNAAETVTASGRRSELRVPLSGIRRKAPRTSAPAKEEPSMRDVAFSSGEGTGFATGVGLNWHEIGQAVDRKLTSYNNTQYVNANKAGRHLREQHGIVSFKRDIPEDLMVTSSDREHVDSVISRAVDESRLPGGALVAAGGWCAPSETLYDLLELESRDGMLSLPEIGVARGGVSFTRGPRFSDIFEQVTGFSFTEEDDIAGNYAPGSNGNVEGPKPCYHVECSDFEDVRLEADGLCITAGLLMQRGYPEVIARTIRGALIAHEHRMNAKLIQRLVADSDAVTMPTQQAGTAAPLLTAIELQVEHYKYAERLPRSTTLEAVFPFWVRGAIRSDLSRRQGVALLEVTDAQVNAWFASRGINPQYVYNWQDLSTTAAGEFTQWPTEVEFLLYAAGTWVRGSSDIITLDTIYDSTLLSQNDYTALFTEEGWLTLKRGFDSRVVTVGIEADGATHQGIEIEHNGTIGAPAGGGGEGA